MKTAFFRAHLLGLLLSIVSVGSFAEAGFQTLISCQQINEEYQVGHRGFFTAITYNEDNKSYYARIFNIIGVRDFDNVANLENIGPVYPTFDADGRILSVLFPRETLPPKEGYYLNLSAYLIVTDPDVKIPNYNDSLTWVERNLYPETIRRRLLRRMEVADTQTVVSHVYWNIWTGQDYGRTTPFKCIELE